MKFLLRVLTPCLLAAAAFSSPNPNLSAKDFGSLAAGDVNIIDSVQKCEDVAAVGKAHSISFSHCLANPCVLVPGNTYTLTGTLTPGSDNAGFRGVGKATTKVGLVYEVVLDQQDDQRAPCIKGVVTTVTFTFLLTKGALPGVYDVTAILYGVNADNEIQDVQYCFKVTAIVLPLQLPYLQL